MIDIFIIVIGKAICGSHVSRDSLPDHNCWRSERIVESRNSVAFQVIAFVFRKRKLSSFKNNPKFVYSRAPNNDLRPESLQTCKDNIYINVFDEVIVDALEVSLSKFGPSLLFDIFYNFELKGRKRAWNNGAQKEASSLSRLAQDTILDRLL